VPLTERSLGLCTITADPVCEGYIPRCISYLPRHFRNIGHHCTFTFLPARRYASAGYRDRNVSVCPSVCPSVTRRYCVKTKKASGMICSPSGSSKTLVFRRQISSPDSKGFPPNGGLKQGLVGKIQRFLPARRYASAGYSDRNVSVCPSVRPSRAGIVSKRSKLAA